MQKISRGEQWPLCLESSKEMKEDTSLGFHTEGAQVLLYKARSNHGKSGGNERYNQISTLKNFGRTGAQSLETGRWLIPLYLVRLHMSSNHCAHMHPGKAACPGEGFAGQQHRLSTVDPHDFLSKKFHGPITWERPSTVCPFRSFTLLSLRLSTLETSRIGKFCL